MDLQFIRIRALIKQDNFIEYFIRLAVIVKYMEKCFGGQLNSNLDVLLESRVGPQNYRLLLLS